mmetsp:Transcript_869/g.2789  ORF Transcript_869/g.2789 Transcript_869/m.2789 type:complete len:246 (-) Transcript_869:1030-1767(-)
MKTVSIVRKSIYRPLRSVHRWYVGGRRGVWSSPWLMSGVLEELAAAPASMGSSLRLVTLCAGFASAPDRVQQLVSTFQSVPRGYRRQAVEGIAQCVLFVGFPRVLTSFAALETAGLLERMEDENARVTDGVFEQIYGASAAKVSGRMQRFHPLMETWVRDFAYTQVLGRTSVLSVRERELCAIGVLVGLDSPAVLVGHIKGALRVGASTEEVRAVLDHTTAVWGSDAADRADAVWHTYKNARYIL